MGVILVEEKTKTFFDEENNVVQESFLEKSIISNATIQAVLGTSFRITGLTGPNEASELALLLRAGALAASCEIRRGTNNWTYIRKRKYR